MPSPASLGGLRSVAFERSDFRCWEKRCQQRKTPRSWWNAALVRRIDELRSSIGLDAAALRGAAAVVRDRGHVADERDLEAGGLESAEGAFAAGAGALHEDGDAAHAVLHRAAARF